ncbi:MAG: polysaccharide deacetylase family protein [Solirubrobacteraceae bacterium]|nr:polysaccharide deacetylase family protein [Solirubrobacteraceae bacterium]
MRPAPLVLAGAAAWCGPGLAPHVPSLCGPLGISRTLPADTAEVALTFDDGPHAQGTPAVLELLAAHGARATFFLIGEQVERHRGLAAEIAAAGHGIALHGYRHRNLMRIAPRALAADLDRAHALIAEVTGIAPSVYRPPYGIFSPAGLVIARRRGWEPMLWSKWGTDWKRFIRPEKIAQRVTTGVVGGDVLLLHDADHYSARDSWRRTAQALPLVLDALARRGLRSVAL